jgi:hypothetical protein
MSLRTYTVTLDTPSGIAQLDVPSTLGPDAAKRRAFFTACALGWGDLDDIMVTDVSEIIEGSLV